MRSLYRSIRFCLIILLVSGVVVVAAQENVKLPEYEASMIIERPEGSAGGLSFSPFGVLLAIGRQDGRVQFWDIVENEEFAIFDAHQSQIASITFTPDGTQLVTSSFGDNAVQVLDAVSGEILQHLPTGDLGVYPVEISPNGELIAAGTGNGNLFVWNTEDYERYQVFQDAYAVYDIEFSLDGNFIYCTTPLVFGTLIRQYETTGFKLTSAYSGGGLIEFLPTQSAFSIRLFTVIHGSIAEVDVAIGDVYQSYELSEEAISEFAFSPNGRLLAYSESETYNLYLWDMQTSAQVARLIGHESYISDLVFSPDGRWLASGAWDGSVRLWEVPKAFRGE